MTDSEVDALIFQALSTPAGQKFHQWLTNNYLMTIAPTKDPYQAVFNNGQQSLVTAVNTRYARHVQIQEKQRGSDSRGSGRKPGKPIWSRGKQVE